MIYIAIFALLAFLVVAEVGLDEPRTLAAGNAIAIGAIFWLMSFARWHNGTDWDSYKFVFDHFSNRAPFADALGGFMGMEPGFLAANFLMAWIGSYHLFLSAIGLLVIAPKIYTIIDFSPCAAYSCLFYFSYFLGDIFFVRQSIAISICFFSVRYLLANKRREFFILVLIATTFHYSSIVFLLAWYLRNKRSRSVFYDVSIILASLAFSLFLLEALTHYFSNALAAFEYIGNRIGYIENNNSTSPMSSMSRDIFRILQRVTAYFFFVSRYKWIKLERKRLYSILLNLDFASVIITCLFSVVATQMVRFGLYFSVSEILLFPLSILSFQGMKKQVAILGGIAYLFVQFYVILLPFYNLYIPYHFWGSAL